MDIKDVIKQEITECRAKKLKCVQNDRLDLATKYEQIELELLNSLEQFKELDKKYPTSK